MTLYEQASGAKINVDKCKGLWTGQFKDRTDQLLGFEWYNNYIPDKILGIYFGNTDCTTLNLDGKIQKLKGITNAWTHRDLSYKGKALVINGLLTSILWYLATTIHIPQETTKDLEQIIYQFFWNKKAPLTNREVLALPLLSGGFNIQRIELKIQALRLNTLRRLLDPEPAHWKRLTGYFLSISNTRQRILTLTQDYSVRDINKNIPKFHRELLTTWNKYREHVERKDIPKNIEDIMQEPIFKNPHITSCDNTPLLYKDWVEAGITKIRDITYEVVPGFLPAIALQEILEKHEKDEKKTIVQTQKELDLIINAMPENWTCQVKRKQATKQKHLMPAQPKFDTVPEQSADMAKDITQMKTRDFYTQLRNDKNITIPALEYWRRNLQPTPTIDQQHWQTIYSPLITNKQGDVNWKVTHRILPTAQRLYRMGVYQTDRCHLCNEKETLEHVLIHCINADNLWKFISPLVAQISEHKIQLNDSIKILGITDQQNDGLNKHKRQLINWILTTGRCALHKSAVDYRVRGEIVEPQTLFVATAKSHINYEYKRAIQQNRLTELEDQWCVNEVIAKLVNRKLTIMI